MSCAVYWLNRNLFDAVNTGKNLDMFIFEGAQAWNIRLRVFTQVRPAWVGDLGLKIANLYFLAL